MGDSHKLAIEALEIARKSNAYSDDMYQFAYYS